MHNEKQINISELQTEKVNSQTKDVLFSRILNSHGLLVFSLLLQGKIGGNIDKVDR